MKIRDLYVLDEINRQDLNNSQWGVYQFLQPRNTKEFFGTDEDFMLPAGAWLVVWIGNAEPGLFERLEPEYRKTAQDGDEELLFFNVSD